MGWVKLIGKFPRARETDFNMVDVPDESQQSVPQPDPPVATNTAAQFPAPRAAATLPSGIDVAQMAANMIQSAVKQRNTIAESFEAQRASVLEAVAAQKSRALDPLTLPRVGEGGQPAVTPAGEAEAPSDVDPSNSPHSQAVVPDGIAPTMAATETAERHEPPPVEQQQLESGPVDHDLPGATNAHSASQSANHPAGPEALSAEQMRTLLGLLEAASLAIDNATIAAQVVEAFKALVAQEVRVQLQASKQGSC